MRPAPDIIRRYVDMYKEFYQSRPGYGGTGVRRHGYFLPFVASMEPKSVLDYGCGICPLLEAICQNKDTKLLRYEPAIEEYSKLPDGPVDLVICSDVLEHIPEDGLDYVLSEIASISPNVIFSICRFKAKLMLSDGSPAHATLRPPDWWLKRLLAYFPNAEFVCYIFQPKNRQFIVTTFPHKEHSWVVENHDTPPKPALSPSQQVVLDKWTQDWKDHYIAHPVRSPMIFRREKHIRGYLVPIVYRAAPNTLLAYNCGSDLVGRNLSLCRKGIKCIRYDPTIEKYSKPVTAAVDLAICASLHRLPECAIQLTLEDIRRLTDKAVFYISTIRDKNKLDTGRPFTSTIRPIEWWMEQIAAAFGKSQFVCRIYPDRLKGYVVKTY